MRAPKTEAVGTSGQSIVKAQLEKLGWAPVLNPEHDLGTDIWVVARDNRRFDLGALAGIQVKSGNSWFDEPEYENGNVRGWWFRGDNEHFDYWTEHNIPHLLVLHDQKADKSYWVHVTRDRIVSTGKQSKILVSADSIIDRDHLEQLLKVATSKPMVKQWEGSSLKAGREVPVSAQLRYALITPRLVSPHRNASVDAVSAAQAIAMLTQVRMADIGYYLKKQPLLNPVEAGKSDDANWRLYGAMHEWLTTDDRSQLIGFDQSSLLPEQRAAVTVCAVNALFEDHKPKEAVDLLNALLVLDIVNPVDHAWLQAHRMRCLVELGELQSARVDALQVQLLRHVAPSDPTARALSGVAALAIVNTDDLFVSDISEAIQAGDNLASWWRSQTFVTALGKQFDNSYEAWGNDASVTFNAEDVVANGLRSTMLMAGYMADSPSWRRSSTLSGKHRLMAARGNESVTVDAFRVLVYAGADKVLKLAVSRMLETGPTRPITLIAEEIDLVQSTRSTLKANLTFLKSAADVLSESASVTHAEWALRFLSGNTAEVEKLQSRFFVDIEVIEMLAALVKSVSADMRKEIMKHIVELPVVEDQSIAGSWSRVIARIDINEWSDGDVKRLSERAEGDNFEFLDAIEFVIARRDAKFRATLISRIAAGDFSALASFGDLTDLPVDAAKGMIAELARRVDTQTDKAARGAYGIGGHDMLKALVLLNVWHSEIAVWDPCIRALAEPSSHGDHITGAIRALGAFADKIPEDIIVQLHTPLDGIYSRRPESDSFFGMFSQHSDPRGAAALTITKLFPDEMTQSRLAELVRGEPKQRAAAVQIVGLWEDEKDISLLAALSTDNDTEVQMTAAYCLARWIVKQISPDSSAKILIDVLASGGVKCASAARQALGEADASSDGVQVLIDILKGIPSAAVQASISMAEQK